MNETEYRELCDEKVAAGIEWLDGFRPGWEHTIDLAKLDLADPEFCICGQTFHKEARENGKRSGYEWAANYAEADTWNLGFVTPPGPARTGDFKPWKVLDEAWVDAIKARYETGVFSDTE